MTNPINPQAPTPASTHAVAKPPVEQQVQTVEVEVVGNQNAISFEEQAAAMKFIERGAVCHTEIDFEIKLTNIKMAYEGCLYVLGKRQLQSEKDDKSKGEIFNMLLEKSSLKKSAVYERIRFAQALIDENVITLRLLLRIEEEEKASPELKSLLDKRVGSKKGIEIQEKLGYLPSKEPKKALPAKKSKTLKERLDEKSAQVEALLAEIKKLLESKELRSEVKDKAELETLRTEFVQMESSVMKFKSIGLYSIPEDLVQLAP